VSLFIETYLESEEYLIKQKQNLQMNLMKYYDVIEDLKLQIAELKQSEMQNAFGIQLNSALKLEIVHFSIMEE